VVRSPRAKSRHNGVRNRSHDRRATPPGYGYSYAKRVSPAGPFAPIAEWLSERGPGLDFSAVSRVRRASARTLAFQLAPVAEKTRAAADPAGFFWLFSFA